MLPRARSRTSSRGWPVHRNGDRLCEGISPCLPPQVPSSPSFSTKAVTDSMAWEGILTEKKRKGIGETRKWSGFGTKEKSSALQLLLGSTTLSDPDEKAGEREILNKEQIFWQTFPH